MQRRTQVFPPILAHLTVFALFAALVSSTYVQASSNATVWDGKEWTHFADRAVSTSFESAFSVMGNRRPILRELVEFEQNNAVESKAFAIWLQEKIKISFKNNDRDSAYQYKGFLTCMRAGDCRTLSKSDPSINNAAKSFKPQFDKAWSGIEIPGGKIDWATKRLGGLGKLFITNQFWDDELGVYLVLGSMQHNRSNDPDTAFYTPVELRFYAPCSFTGRGGADGVAKDGGPDLDMVSGGRCSE